MKIEITVKLDEEQLARITKVIISASESAAKNAEKRIAKLKGEKA